MEGPESGCWLLPWVAFGNSFLLSSPPKDHSPPLSLPKGIALTPSPPKKPGLQTVSNPDQLQKWEGLPGESVRASFGLNPQVGSLDLSELL